MKFNLDDYYCEILEIKKDGLCSIHCLGDYSENDYKAYIEKLYKKGSHIQSFQFKKKDKAFEVLSNHINKEK